MKFFLKTGDKDIFISLKEGIKIAVPNNIEVLSTYVYLEQETWFEDESAFVTKFAKPGYKVLDIGSSYGFYTLLLSKHIGPSGKVWSFEPTPETVGYLKKSVEVNDFHNVKILEMGLSDIQGKALLNINYQQPETNEISLELKEDKQQIEISIDCIDNLRASEGIKDIDFVKLDAEGHNVKIVKGAAKFFKEESPLVMVDIKHGKNFHLELLDLFNSMGYDVYIYNPGIGVLVPLYKSDNIDGYLLNAFVCRNDRAEMLAEDNLIVNVPMVKLPDCTDPNILINEFADHPFFRIFGVDKKLVEKWQELQHIKVYVNALRYYLSSRNTSISIAERYGCLKKSFDMLKEICSKETTLERLLSFAYVARDFGQRMVAFNILNGIITNLKERKEGMRIGELFLIPHTYEGSDSPDNALNWMIAYIFEMLEQTVVFSSFFNPRQSLAMLRPVESLYKLSFEMKRRKQLSQMRLNKKCDIEQLKLLKTGAPNNLNPILWSEYS